MSDEPTPTVPEIAFVGGNPTAAEIAAVTAVLAAAVEQAASEQSAAVVRSAWSWSQRGLRSPIAPRDGAWRGFAG